MLSFPPSQRAQSPVAWGGGMAGYPVRHCLQARPVDTNRRGREDAGQNVLVAGSNLNRKNKNMCGEGRGGEGSGGSARWMIQREAPLRPGGSVGMGGMWGFCLESTLSNPLQDADISRNRQRGSGGVEAATHPGVKSKQPGQGLQAAQGSPVSRLLLWAAEFRRRLKLCCCRCRLGFSGGRGTGREQGSLGSQTGAVFHRGFSLLCPNWDSLERWPLKEQRRRQPAGCSRTSTVPDSVAVGKSGTVRIQRDA